MKKPHFVRAITALSLSACMVMSLAACQASDKSKKDQESTSEESKQEQQADPVEETKQDHTSDKNNYYADDANYTQISSNPPASYDRLTIDDLYDTWVNENGTYMYYSNIYGDLVDYLGTHYEIIDVYDNGVLLTEGHSSFTDYVTYEYSPLPNVFFFPMYLQGDELIVGEEHLYRASSEKGQQYMEAIVEEITDVELQCTSYFEYESVPVEFTSHGMIQTNPNDTYFEQLFWKCENGLLEMSGDMYSGYDDYINYGSIHRMSDDTYFIVSNYGAGVYLSANENDGYRVFDGEYVLYSLGDDATFFANVTDLNGTATDCYSNPAPDWDFTFVPNDDPMGYPGIELNNETYTMYGYINAMNTDLSTSNVTIFPRDSLAGQILIYREDVVHGKIDNIFVLDKYTSSTNGITVEVEILDWDGRWTEDTPDVWVDNTYKANTDTYIATYGPLVDLSNCGYTTLITYTIPKSQFSSADEIMVANGYESFIGNSRLDEDEYDVSEDGDNYIVTIEVDYNNYDSYVLTDCEVATNLYAFKDVNAILSQNPNASLWGSTCATGDILDLVDLDYLEQSIVNDDGVAVFWVSTPEQLATATYYINEMDLSWDSYDTYYYIHLMDNIDLAGYEWAPIGINEYEHNYPYRDLYPEHYMTGIFFGNGKTIKNVYMDPTEYGTGFFGYCEYTTVIGLTLARPNPNGFVKNSYQYLSDFYDSYAFAEPLGMYNEFIDCHVIIDSSDETCCPFPDADYTLSLHVDCSAFKIDSSTGYLTDLNFENSKSILFYDMCTDKNWVADYYRTNDGGYSYDAASEYEDYLSDPTGFIDGSYYYGDGSDTPERHYDYWLAGYMYNGLFMTQYGCTVDPEYADSIILPESGDEG